MSHSPRICVLTDSFYPVVGGGENHAFLLCREMVKRGAQVLVVTRRRQPDSRRYEEIHGYPIHRVRPTGWPRWGKYLMIPPAIWKLARLRHRYDVIYVCGLRVLGVVGVLAAQLLHKTCVLRSESCGELSGGFIWDSPHGGTHSMTKAILGGAVRLRNRCLLKAAAFVSISEVIRQEYLSCGVKPARIHAITNGVDTDQFAPVTDHQRRALRTQLSMPDRAVFAYSGKLNRGKGLPFLLRIWDKFAAERNDVHLMLIGSGGLQFLSCEDELRTYVREHHLEGTVTFTGYVENVQTYLQASDFFVFPSENEALGISLIEALACALPSVASRIGGIVDIITDGETGRLAESGADLEWLGIMKTFLDRREECRELGRRGRALVLQRFGIGHVTDQHLDLFQRVTTTHKESSR